MSLDTLTNVKSRLGVTGSADDSLLNLLLDSADRWVADYCARDFEGGTFTEYFPGNTIYLHLRNYPVTSVTSVKVDSAQGFGADTVIASSSYVTQLERGVIQSKVGPFVATGKGGLVNADRADWTRSPRAVQVVYATATSNVPADVKQAYAILIGHWYRRVKTEQASNFQNVDRQALGDTVTSFRDDPADVPGDVYRLLAPHRNPAL